MITLSGKPSGWLSETPLARPSIAEAIAASRSALGRANSWDDAISRPSADTAIAAMAPAVVWVKRLTSQLKFCASTLTPGAGVVILGSLSSDRYRPGQGHSKRRRKPTAPRLDRARAIPAEPVAADYLAASCAVPRLACA